MSNLIPVEGIMSKIYLIRGQKIMLDMDLAELYHVPTGRLNEQVKRNFERFPDDFMFQLTKEEYQNLKSQNAISRWGGRRKPPYAFTEQGVAMLSSVLKTKRAILVNIAIMRAFVKIKKVLSTHKEVSRKLKELEEKIENHDGDIRCIFAAIRELITFDKKPKKRIGFTVD